MITCSKCGETKPQDEYYKQPRNKSGYMGHCKVCELARKAANNKKHQESDPEKWAERRRVYVARYKAKYPDRVAELDWSYRIKTRFGVTSEKYYEMLESQGGACAGCKRKPNGKKLAIDHDRKCCPENKSCGACVRGLLCSNCNTALGLLREEEETINNLLEYIKNYE